ncbi:MAG: NfeD family protein [Ignavibacteriales bacterium]|nr:NfeD family protein [Ignavibacteriales bacterium]
MTATISMPAELLWFLAGLVVMFSELILPGFVMIFFGAGAWVAALTIVIGLAAGFDTQLIIWLVSSLLLLLLFRRQGQRYFKGRVIGKLKPGETIDDIKGQRVVVKNDIRPDTVGGKVEFHGTRWDAVADVPIKAGDVVEIVERNNLKLKVRPLTANE